MLCVEQHLSEKDVLLLCSEARQQVIKVCLRYETAEKETHITRHNTLCFCQSYSYRCRVFQKTFTSFDR